MAPRIRKYKSGNQKRKKKTNEVKFIQSQKGAMERFLVRERMLTEDIANEEDNDGSEELIEDLADENPGDDPSPNENDDNTNVNDENPGDDPSRNADGENE